MMNIARKLLLACFILFTANMQAQTVIKLWEGNPPVSNEITEPESYNEDGGRISNVSVPTITIFSPPKEINNKMAVIICPGGGYTILASHHEGTEFAQWLNTQGITAFVLKYRLPNKHKTVPLDDAQQAIRYVREHAQELNIDVNKVGIAGFSAGGHLASTASTHYDVPGTNVRPDFSILFYPVITMGEATHKGSRKNLFGENPSSDDIYLYSNEKQINKDTPPAILLLSDDDKTVLPVNSTSYYDALKSNNVSASMYIFPEGGHGWGMRKSFKYHQQMLDLLQMWLSDIQQK